MAYLTVSHLSRRFGASTVVDDLNFEVSRGEALGIVGPNGAGKSTSLKMIASSLPATSGTILIDGFEKSQRPLQARACVGYAPQEPPLYDEMTVREFLSFVAELQGIPKKACRGALQRVVSQCALETVQRTLCGHLSLGFRKRVGLAAALIHAPGLLLLDEPCAGLDPLQRAQFRRLIASLRRFHAIVISTHLLSEVLESCTRVLIMNHGRILKDFDLVQGSARELEEEFMHIIHGARVSAPDEPKKVVHV